MVEHYDDATAGAKDEVRDDAPERPVSPREAAAQRAHRAAVFGLLFPPLLVYAGLVLLRVYRSRARLDAKHRRMAQLAAMIVTAPIAFVILIVVMLLITPREREADLREYPRPAAMFGVWKGTLQEPQGVVQLEIHLRRDGSVRYLESGAAQSDRRGYWAFTNRQLFLQIRRVTQGHDDWLGRLIAFDARMPADDELLLNESLKLKWDRAAGP